MKRLTIFIRLRYGCKYFRIYRPEWKIGFDVLQVETDLGYTITPPVLPYQS